MLTIPISTDTLLDYLPHKPPMVWIDSILEFSATGGVGLTVIKDNAHYMTNNELRRTACIEFVAQTFAFTNAATMKQNNIAYQNQRAFLAAIKDFDIRAWPELPSGAVLRTEVKKERQFGPISIIVGQTFWKEQLLASGELKVFAG